jgi:hypothetical protein
MKRFIQLAAVLTACLVFYAPDPDRAQAARVQRAALGVDVDFYTGPVSRDVWKRMKRAGVKFVVAQAYRSMAPRRHNAGNTSWPRSMNFVSVTKIP